MEKKKKEKSELPGFTYLFCVTVMIGLLRGLLTTYQMFVDYTGWWGAEYAWVAAIDVGLHLIELAMYAGMLVYIALRKRTFLICFWVDFGCRVTALFVVLFAGGNPAEFLTSLIFPILWTAYFYRSNNFAKAFTPYKEPFFSNAPGVTSNVVAPKKEAVPSSPLSKKESVAAAASSQTSEAEKDCAPEAHACAVSTASAAVPTSAVTAPAAGDAVSEPPEKQELPHSDKRRFCKYCGTELSPADSICPNCGKRVRIVIPWKKTAFFSLLALSLVGNVVLAVIVATQQQQVEIYQEKQIELYQELNLEKQYSLQDLSEGGDVSWPNTYWRNKSAAEAGFMGLNVDQLNSLVFANKYVAVVTKSGTKWHHPDCFHLATASEVYIYSIEGAEKAGYEPCEDCKELSVEEFKEKYGI